MRNYILIAAAIISAACESELSRLAKVPLTIEVKRFEQDLFAVNDSNYHTQIAALQQTYGEFFTLFCANIIAIGSPDSSDFKPKLYSFLSDTIVQSGCRRAQEVFSSSDLNGALTLAFKRFRLYFPNEKIPQIYTYTAGFNQSIILTDSAIGLGLDKYLGADYPLYSQLGYYRYLQRNMYPAKLPADALRFFAAAMFPSPTSNLMQRIIWEGKLLYLVRRLLPEAPDSCLFGFSGQQITSCLANEAYMWSVLVSNQLLFSHAQRDLRDFTDEAPFTLRFSQEAPGRAATWLGYRIVEQYMRRSRATLPQLMHNHNAQEILDLSRYDPR